MTTEQKNSYLEAHMEVQQHMHQVSMQLNKQAQNHTTSHNQSMVNNQSISGAHQSSSSVNVSHPYLNANPIKVCGRGVWQIWPRENKKCQLLNRILN